MDVLYYFQHGSRGNSAELIVGNYSVWGRLMAEGEWEIIETRITGSDPVLRVPAAPNLKPMPGQYFQVYAAGFDETFAVSLFLVNDHQTLWDLTGEIPAYWIPGIRLRWRGPLGRGFDLPVKISKAAFVPWLDHGLRLLPLVQHALSEQAAVVWYSNLVPDWLPPSVEVLPVDLLPEALNWAEYLAATCERNNLQELVAALELKPPFRLNCTVEVLVHTLLVCGGIGECGVCSVKTRSGWKTACKDGPVFDLDQLELAA